MRNIHPTRQAAGFSLVELLVTLAVLGVLVAIAAPSFREFTANQRVKAASFDLMASLMLARSEAIKRNALSSAPVLVSPIGSYWSDGWEVKAPNGSVISQQAAMPSMTITCKAAGTVVSCDTFFVRYQGSGRLTGTTSPSFELSNSGTTSVRCIGIDLSGRPSTKVGACS